MPEAWENSPRRLLLHTFVLTARILRRWSRDVSTMSQSLAMPVVLLITIHIVFEDGVSAVTGESALYGSVPLIAMIGAMTGAIIGAIGVMRERDDGLLSRLWVMPVHRASGLLSRLAADAIRIFVTTLVIMGAGMVMGFRFEKGLLSAVAWVFIPVIFGMAFSVVVILLALYSANTIAVEATDLLAATTMFFCTGLVPLSQYPDWIQPIVEHQPVSYVVETMRGLSIGGPVLQPFLGTVAWSVGIIAVCAVPLTVGYRRASMR
ncbi:ABC transporter permease [Mycobacterium sp. SMC-4]|uniref:ABC transporter permease n=1 Tax=Mycobacterium sp. SMC-4 TaxID=2857059 RepID=UPI0021B2CDFF